MQLQEEQPNLIKVPCMEGKLSDHDTQKYEMGFSLLLAIHAVAGTN